MYAVNPVAETSRIVIIPDSTEPVSAATVTAGTDENAFGKTISLDVTFPISRVILSLPARNSLFYVQASASFISGSHVPLCFRVIIIWPSDLREKLTESPLW